MHNTILKPYWKSFTRSKIRGGQCSTWFKCVHFKTRSRIFQKLSELWNLSGALNSTCPENVDLR